METQHKPETVVIRFSNLIQVADNYGHNLTSSFDLVENKRRSESRFIHEDGSEVHLEYSVYGEINNLHVFLQGESLVPLLQQYAMENFVSRIGYFPVRLEMADGTVFETAMMIRGQEMDFASNTVTKVDMGVVGIAIKQSRKEVSTAA